MGSDQARKIVLGLNELSKRQSKEHYDRMEKLDEQIFKAMDVYDRLLREETQAEMTPYLQK